MDMHDQLFFPAQVRAVTEASQRTALIEILRNSRVLDADVLEQHPPFFWRGLISNTRLDAYFTHMALSSLRNYASEAAEGVSFLPGHDHRHLPIGSSLTGEVREQGSDAEVRADFYTLTGLQIGTVDTDDFVTGIKAGLTRDLSIGFYGGKMICDLCGEEYWRGRCPHLAGFIYEVEKDGVIGQRLCTVGIEDAHLAEVSGVYDGATPGAMIEKIYEMARAGAIDEGEVRQAEQVYRLDKEVMQRMLQLPAMQKKHAGVDVRTERRKDERMNEQQFERLKEILVNAGVVPADQRATLDEESALVAADKLAVRVAELTPRAADGDTYRNDLVAEALAEGVRAYGQGFAQATYEATLRSAPLAVIKQMRDDWKVVGDARFPGGRSTTEGENAPNDDGQGRQVELKAPAKQFK